MKTDCTEQKLSFQRHGAREVVGAFDGGTVTSDAGALLLRETERARGIVRQFAKCFVDFRDPRRIEHSVEELLQQRIFGLCLGYEDLTDHDELRRDPLLALCCGKSDPTGQSRKRERDRGAALAGKSTLSRLELTELSADETERYSKIACKQESVERFFVERFLAAHSVAPERIVLDLDLTDIVLHGKQEERFFHGYYDSYCYLPLYIFCGTHVLCAMLRPASIDSVVGLTDLLGSLLGPIRERWPGVHIVLRADSGFCREELMLWVEERKATGERIDFLFGLAKNSRLLALIGEELEQAEAQHKASGKAERLFRELSYQTQDSWSRPRRVIAKAEHLGKGPNPRFIVTSLSAEQFPGQELYENDYCGRGEAENRIKEQQLGLFADRASSSSFLANQLRVWFSAVAYTLLEEMRRIALPGTELATAQCSTIRLKLLKLGARVLHSTRRIRLMFSSSYPCQALFALALHRLRLAPEVLRL